MIDQCLGSMLIERWRDRGFELQVFVINNHPQFGMDEKFKPQVTIFHNNLRASWSTGHLARNWNQALILGFENLKEPAADLIVTMQDDTLLQPDWLDKLAAHHHSGLDFVQFGIGDNLCSYTPEAVKRIGLWDERFCNIGYQEADYFLRAVAFLKERATVNDMGHNRVWNPRENDVIQFLQCGNARGEKYNHDSQMFHPVSRAVFAAKYGALSPENWSFDPTANFTILQPSYMMYPYFEKDVETLREQGYVM